MLPDYKNVLFYTPLKYRHLHHVRLVADLAATTGTATLRASESSPSVGLTGTAGSYVLTFPKGQSLVPESGFVSKVTPAATDATTVAFGLLDPATGTCTVFSMVGSTGAVGSPTASGGVGVLYVNLLVGKA
jgi:hypothetical protein